MELRVRREDGVEERFSVPTRAVVGGVSVAGAVSSLVALLTFFLISLPDREASRLQSESDAQLALLRQALAPDSAHHRAASVAILLDAGLLHDPTRALRTRADTPGSVPHWPQSNVAPMVVPDSIVERLRQQAPRTPGG